MTIGHFDFVAPRVGIVNGDQKFALLLAFLVILIFQTAFFSVWWWRDRNISEVFFFKTSRMRQSPSLENVPSSHLVHAFFLLSSVLVAAAAFGFAHSFTSFFENPFVAFLFYVTAFPISVAFVLWLYFKSRELFPSYYVAEFLKSVGRRHDFEAWLEIEGIDFKNLALFEKMREVEKFY